MYFTSYYVAAFAHLIPIFYTFNFIMGLFWPLYEYSVLVRLLPALFFLIRFAFVFTFVLRTFIAPGSFNNIFNLFFTFFIFAPF